MTKKTMKSITNKDLKEFRLERNLSQVEVAEKFGISPRSLQAYERGESRIPKYVDKIFDLLNIVEGREIQC